MIRKIYIIFTLVLFTNILFAQETYTTTGGNATGTTGNASYTIGQVFYVKKTGTNGNYITDGVQQAFEISSIINIPVAKDINLTAHPNPTSDYLIVDIENYESDNLTYQFFDINGKLLISGQINSQETCINTNKLKPSIYFVKIIDGNKIIKTFKIIKN